MRLAIVLLAGCAHYYKLDVASVTSLDLSGDGTLCARGSLIDVVAITRDGGRHAEGRNDQIREDEFDPKLVEITASVGSLHDRSWNPPADPLAMLTVPRVELTAKLIARPEVSSKITLTPTWNCEAPIVYVGGTDGANGLRGNTSLADRGVGGPGNPGDRGGDGPRSLIEVGWVTGPAGERLALAKVTTPNTEDALYILDPRMWLRVAGVGGQGGAGGTGGFGGSVTSGKGGKGGPAGDGGDGGDGGEVVVHWDAASPELAKLIAIDISGGPGGEAGFGGPGGTSPQLLVGDAGDPGHEGAPGKPGTERKEPVIGLTARLAARMSDPHQHTNVDDSRTYVGTATVEEPVQARHTLELVSTRTRAFHFTIAFPDHSACTLQVHRPETTTQLRYDLDAPASCDTPRGPLVVQTAVLELTPATAQLQLSYAGTIGGKPIKMTIAAKRR